MKLNQYIAALCISLTALTACESDLDKVTFNPEEATASSLKIDGQEALYTLDKNKGKSEVFMLKWSKPDMGYQASVTNILQMDLKDKNFANVQVIDASSDKTSYTFTTENLNKTIQTLFNKYKMETQRTTIELRIASAISAAADTVFSEALAVNIMPYEGEAIYPSLGIPGKYNNWSFTDQQIYSINDDGVYEAIVYFNGQAGGSDPSQDGWKIGTSWQNNENWGVSTQPAAEAPSVTLTPGSGNITAYSKNSYHIKFDKNTLKLEMSQGHDSWGIVGLNGDWNNDLDLTYGKEEETGQFYLGATVTVTNGNTFKIRPDKDPAYTDQLNAGNIDYEGDITEASTDQNFELTAGNGKYEIKWYFNKAVPKLTAHKK